VAGAAGRAGSVVGPDGVGWAPAAPPAPLAVPDAPRSLGGFDTIVWATGFRRRYDWLRVPGARGADGELVHRRGVTPVPGLYVLGLRWQHTMTSHQLGGVGRDAVYLAGQIAGAPRDAVALELAA
jgi:putative flavoprotein involved in K+ transport